MAELGPEFAAALQAACEAGAAAASAALSDSFGGRFKWSVGACCAYEGTVPSEVVGPGLGILLNLPAGSALLFIPESVGWIPAWYAAPDTSGAAKLSVLAQQLGRAILPDTADKVDFPPQRVERLDVTLVQGKIAAQAEVLPLHITCEEKAAVAWLVWPLTDPANAFGAPDESESRAAMQSLEPSAEPPAEPPAVLPTTAKGTRPENTVPPTGQSTLQQLLRYQGLEDGLRLLPNYARSLLKVQVPVIVTLAEVKQPVAKILEICPGTIIQFDKSCDEMLTLEVGGCNVALGEAVKIGDKFGLRVTGIALPIERFTTVRGKDLPASTATRRGIA